MAKWSRGKSSSGEDGLDSSKKQNDFDVAWGEGAEPEGPESQNAPARPEKVARVKPAARPKDPVVQALTLTIFAVIILALVTIAYALITGVFGNGAPKTAAQQRLMASQARVEGGSTTSTDWKMYIRGLIDTKQYKKAQEMINEGASKVPKQEIYADMTYMQAELYLAQGDLDKSLETADKALTQIKTTYDSAMDTYREKGEPSLAMAGGLVDNYWEILLLKAEIYEKKADWKQTVAVYDEYLAEKTDAATIYTQRGKAKEQMGDTAGAEADYRETLKYIADDKEALAGLKRIGVQ